MSAERDGVLERGDEDFAIRTGSQMSAYLTANVRGELVIDIGRQLPEKVHTMTLAVIMPVGGWLGSLLWRRCLFLGHDPTSPDLWSS